MAIPSCLPETAELYEIGGQLTFNAMAWWEDLGAWGATLALMTLPPEADDVSLGSALTHMFEASARLPPETGREGTNALLKEVGVRSRAALLRAARNAFVSRQPGGLVQIIPTERDEGGGGWVHLPEGQIDLEDPSEQEMGSALRIAFAKCR